MSHFTLLFSNTVRVTGTLVCEHLRRADWRKNVSRSKSNSFHLILMKRGHNA